MVLVAQCHGDCGVRWIAETEEALECFQAGQRSWKCSKGTPTKLTKIFLTYVQLYADYQRKKFTLFCNIVAELLVK